MIEISGGGDGRDVAVGGQRTLPDTLPVLPLRETVPLPDTLTPLAIGQERSVRLVNDVLVGNRTLVMVASREPELETPGRDQLYDVGVAGMVARMLKLPDGALRILVQGGQRVRIDEWVGEQPYLLPGQGFRYSSGAVLETPVGAMQGSYQMLADDGAHFDAPIAPFTLAMPGLLH